jgi:hypothetical protein
MKQMSSSSSTVSTPQEVDGHSIDPIVLYSRSLYDYTLNLWTEFQKVAEEKTRERPVVIATVTPPSQPQAVELEDRVVESS